MDKPWMPKVPVRLPKTQADIDRMLRQAYNSGREAAMQDSIKTIIGAVLYILHDKHGGTPEEIQALNGEFIYAIESINKGYMKVSDIWRLLKDDCGVIVRFL